MPHRFDAQADIVHKGSAFGCAPGTGKEKIIHFFRTAAHFALKTGMPGNDIAARSGRTDADVHPAGPRAVPRKGMQCQNRLAGRFEGIPAFFGALGRMGFAPCKVQIEFCGGKRSADSGHKRPGFSAGEPDMVAEKIRKALHLPGQRRSAADAFFRWLKNKTYIPV